MRRLFVLSNKVIDNKYLSYMNCKSCYTGERIYELYIEKMHDDYGRYIDVPKITGIKFNTVLHSIDAVKEHTHPNYHERFIK